MRDKCEGYTKVGLDTKVTVSALLVKVQKGVRIEEVGQSLSVSVDGCFREV